MYDPFVAASERIPKAYKKIMEYLQANGFKEKPKDSVLFCFEYVGNFDTTEEELRMIQRELNGITLDEYDRLIQLCDSIAGAEGVLYIEERMEDVKRRYGSYTQKKWDSNLALKKHFEEKLGKSIYVVVEKESFKPCNHTKHNDRDTWELPGGHREAGERIIDTAKRELYEETGALEFLRRQ